MLLGTERRGRMLSAGADWKAGDGLLRRTTTASFHIHSNSFTYRRKHLIP